MNITEEQGWGRNLQRGMFTIIQKAKIGSNVKIGNFCEIRKDCEIGDNTSFGSRCTLSAGTKVGKDCVIKYGFVATDTPDLTRPGFKTPCKIGSGVKIGANVTLMPGVTIGDNVTIGANSQVRDDIPDGEIWFGIPARKYDR